MPPAVFGEKWRTAQRAVPAWDRVLKIDLEISGRYNPFVMKKSGPLKTIGKGLAGALAIAGGTSAYGAIVFVSPPADLTNVPGPSRPTRNWDVNSDGITDFVFQNRYPNTPPGGTGVVWQMNMNPAFGTELTNGILSYSGPFVRYAYAFQGFILVSPNDQTFSTQTQVVLGSRYSYGSFGQNYYGGFAAGDINGSVPPGTFAFAGFRFMAADGIHYGYIRLSVSAGLIDFDYAAYETTPGLGTGSPVPEPGTLALLTFGAVAVIGATVKRRRHE